MTITRHRYYKPVAYLLEGLGGYNGDRPGWLQVKGITNGIPLGSPGDVRTAVTLRSACSTGFHVSSGSYRVTTAGTYDSIVFDAPVTVTATNGPVVFRNCLFRMPRMPFAGGPSAYYLITCSATGVSQPEFYDCEFDGAGTWADTWLGPSGVQSGNAPAAVIDSSVGVKAVRCYAHHLTHCFDNPTAGSVLDQCYMDNVVQCFSSTGAVSHNDNIQWYLPGATGAQVTNCCLDLYNYEHNQIGNTCNIQNGSAWSTGAVMHDILVDSNYFSHGQFLIRLDAMTAVDINNFIVSNNRFEINPTIAINSGRDSRITWTNNTYNSTGPVHTNQTQTTNVVAGQLIP